MPWQPSGHGMSTGIQGGLTRAREGGGGSCTAAATEENALGDVPRRHARAWQRRLWAIASVRVSDASTVDFVPMLQKNASIPFARSLLDDTTLNPCARVLQLLEQAPVQEPPREGAQAGAKSFQVGVYNHGGVTRLRAATHRYPHACRILTDAVRMVCADRVFSTVALPMLTRATACHSVSGQNCAVWRLLCFDVWRGKFLWREVMRGPRAACMASHSACSGSFTRSHCRKRTVRGPLCAGLA